MFKECSFTAKVSRSAVERDPLMAARTALETLARLTAAQALPRRAKSEDHKSSFKMRSFFFFLALSPSFFYSPSQALFRPFFVCDVSFFDWSFSLLTKLTTVPTLRRRAKRKFPAALFWAHQPAEK